MIANLSEDNSNNSLAIDEVTNTVNSKDLAKF